MALEHPRDHLKRIVGDHARRRAEHDDALRATAEAIALQYRTEAGTIPPDVSTVTSSEG